MLAYGKAHWKSAGVSFHENFWLAASAAGPVITLAIVVAIPDVANMRFRAAGAMRAAEDQRRVSEVSGPRDRPSRDDAVTGPATVGHPVGGPGNQIERCWVVLRKSDRLGGALRPSRSRLSRTAWTWVPPWLAIVVAVGGVGLLAWTLLRGAGDTRRG